MRAIWPEKTPEGLAFTPAYEVVPASQLVFLGAVTPLRDGRVPASIEDQSRACLENLESILDRLGSNARAVKMVQCMTDVRERYAADAAFDEHYSGPRLRPTKTLLEVPAAVVDGARIELEVWAVADPAVTPRVREVLAGDDGLALAVSADAGAVLHALDVAPGDSAGRGAVAELEDCLAQAEQALAPLGATLADLVKLTVSISDLRQWPALRSAIADRFGADGPAVMPLSSTKVGPTAATIGIEAWAATPRERARDADAAGPVAAVDLAGQLLVISGSAAIPVYTGGKLSDMYGYQAEATIAAQTRVSMENYATILEAAGATWDDIFKTSWYVTDRREWDAIVPVAEEYFKRPIPAPTVVEVSKFVLPAVRIEPDMWATLGS